ncbi:hypothetical protein SKAU_G00425490 [Synaphobranchus kaupii]|uniref:Tc1-like transposase DDE domain-containing protein n=1 Tax=Synaphobranchus kaupii TaxID=118154 RepID=A0A9Q1E525_SYNKA|nr:hypothetical protein SKAU_G00425490 [Synaphobranchus kaupii]
MTEAGRRVQPNLSRFTVASVIRTFRDENRIERLPPRGGRGLTFTAEQETAIVNMVLANNVIRLREIQNRVIEDNIIFPNIHTVSLSTIDRVLKRNHVRMKQVYQVPFERNSDRVKELRYQYVQRVLELDANAAPQEYLFVDEAGFNLTKTRRRGRNIIGHRATVDVPGQRGGNITMCAAIGQQGVIHHHAHLGPYNAALLIAFFDSLHNILITPQEEGPEQPNYVIIWDNVSFHRAALVQDWFIAHPRFSGLFLPPYSPFLNPIEELFSAWRWKVYDRNPHERMTLLQAMEEACGDIHADACQGWIRHARRRKHCMRCG